MVVRHTAIVGKPQPLIRLRQPHLVTPSNTIKESQNPKEKRTKSSMDRISLKEARPKACGHIRRPCIHQRGSWHSGLGFSIVPDPSGAFPAAQPGPLCPVLA